MNTIINGSNVEVDNVDVQIVEIEVDDLSNVSVVWLLNAVFDLPFT